MKVGVTQIRRFFKIRSLFGKVGTQFKKVCVSTYTDLHKCFSFLNNYGNRPTLTYISPENGLLCRSVYLSNITSPIGLFFKKNYPYRILTVKTYTDLHRHFDESSSVREREVEHTLVTEVKKRGGIAPKFVSPGMSGMPDRLVLLPESRMAFVELKAPGKKPRVLQEKRMRDLRNLGYRVYVLDRAEKVKEVLDDIHSS